jgi:hypothetical protein
MHRIFFDTNEGNYEHGYWLALPGSLKDIAPIADQLHNGLRVTIYMTNELEMEATLQFDEQYGYWIARPIEGTTKYYDEPEGETDTT